MKKAISILLFAALICATLMLYFQASELDKSTKRDFEQFKKEFNARIDSILQNCDTLKTEIRDVKANTDTLKAGQRAIFETMKENENKSLFDWLWE